MANSADPTDPLGALEASDEFVLTPAEIAAAKKQALDNLRAKKIKAAKAAIVEAETLRLEREEGKRTGIASMDEEVPIFIDLPEFAPFLSVNGERLHHGETKVLPRHVVNSLREQMARAWDHEQDRLGNSIAQKLGARRANDFSSYEGRRIG